MGEQEESVEWVGVCRVVGMVEGCEGWVEGVKGGEGGG